jgi:hypothetical protein
MAIPCAELMSAEAARRQRYLSGQFYDSSLPERHPTLSDQGGLRLPRNYNRRTAAGRRKMSMGSSRRRSLFSSVTTGRPKASPAFRISFNPSTPRP